MSAVRVTSLRSARTRRSTDDARVAVRLTTSQAGVERLINAVLSGRDQFVLAGVDGAVSIRVSVALTPVPPAIAPRSWLADAEIDWETGAIERRRQRASLSRTELRLLACLIDANGDVVSHRRLIAAAWPDDAASVTQNLLGVYVHYLRRRLAAVGLKGAVETVRGEGYRLAVVEEPAAATREPKGAKAQR